MKKNQNRVARQGDSKGARAQVRRQTTTRAGQGLRTYRVFTAQAGETDMQHWREAGKVTARSPLDAARRHLREFKRLAVCRFNQGERDFIFDLVKGPAAAPLAPAPAREGAGVTVVLYNQAKDETFAKVDFTAAEFAGIQEAARKLNLTLEDFFIRTLYGAVAAALPEPSDAHPPAPGALVSLWDRLDRAAREVLAMHTVLIDMLDTQTEGKNPVVPGLQTLGWRAHAELVSIHAALRPLVVAERRAA